MTVCVFVCKSLCVCTHVHTLLLWCCFQSSTSIMLSPRKGDLRGRRGKEEYMHACTHRHTKTNCRPLSVSCPSPFPTAPFLLPTPFHRSEMLTWQAIHFMNTTLRGKKPSHKPRTMLSSLLRNFKRSREEKTLLELQADCDWCVPISSSVLSLWTARTASGL